MKHFYRTFLILMVTILTITTFLVAAPAATAAPSRGSASQRGAFRPTNTWALTGQYIDLAWFYKPPSDGNVTTLGNNFDTFILTKNDESTRDTLKNQGIRTPIQQYLRFEAIMDPGNCTTKPWQNQVAYNAGDFCAISRDHPDWFLLDTNGSRVYDGEGFVMMDPGNTGWQAYWLERAKTMQSSSGWYGVFLDNVEASRGRYDKLGRYPQKYPDNASYTRAVNSMLAYIYNNYFKPQNVPLSGNIIFLNDKSVWYSYMANMDGGMEEGWAVPWRTGWRTVGEWEEHMDRAEKTQASGKIAVLVSQGDQTDYTRQSFAFASYLLVTNGKATFRYTNQYSYNQTWLYDNYNVNIGSPTGPRYQSGSTWKRNFTNGTVTVDPAAHTASITTGSSTAPAPPPASSISVKVNFQPYSSPIPAGFIADAGEAFGSRNGYSYGWSASNTSAPRDRNSAISPSEAHDSMIHSQMNGNLSWQIALPSGNYQVRVMAGDALFYDSVYKVNVENVLVVNGTPSSTKHWYEGTVTVPVTDGFLTLTNASGSVNNKLNFIEITQVSATPFVPNAALTKKVFLPGVASRSFASASSTSSDQPPAEPLTTDAAVDTAAPAPAPAETAAPAQDSTASLPEPTAAPTDAPIATPEAPAAPQPAVNLLYVSSDSSGQAGDVAFDDEDILLYNAASSTWEMYFDGSAAGLADTNVNAFAVLSDGSLLISLGGETTLPGLGAVDDSDILKFVFSSTGSNTAGQFEWYFDGSDVGLTTYDHDIDSISFSPEGKLLISLSGAASATGANEADTVSTADEDLLLFNADSYGSDTLGTFSLYFDGGDVELDSADSEDLGGASASQDGSLYLSTYGDFSVAGGSGSGTSIFSFSPSSLGEDTAGSFSLLFNLAELDFSGGVLDGIHIQ